MATRHPSPLPGPPPRRAQPPRAIRLRRLAPLLAFALVAFGVGVLYGARHVPSERKVAQSYAAAWERGDLAEMHALLSDDARQGVSLRRFTRAYERAAETATISRVRTSRPRVQGSGVAFDATITTRIFGTIAGTVVLPLGGRGDGTPGIAWRP